MLVYHKCYILTELKFLKDLVLTKQAIKRVRYLLLICFYSLNNCFKVQPNVCNGCRDLLVMSMNYRDIAILSIEGSDHRCNINKFSKNKAISLIHNADLTKKSATL